MSAERCLITSPPSLLPCFLLPESSHIPALPQTHTELKSCLSELNKDLHNCNLQIKGMLQNGTEIYAIVNIVRSGGGREGGNGGGRERSRMCPFRLYAVIFHSHHPFMFPFFGS